MHNGQELSPSSLDPSMSLAVAVPEGKGDYVGMDCAGCRLMATDAVEEEAATGGVVAAVYAFCVSCSCTPRVLWWCRGRA